MAKKITEELPELDTTDIARHIELEALLKELGSEYKALTERFKLEIEEGKWPVEGYLVHRWDQIGALDTAAFTKDYTDEDYPEMWADQFTGRIEAELPVETHPHLYTRVPEPAAIKEHMAAADKPKYFKQVPYLKITKVASDG